MSKYRVTIPKALAEKSGIEPGDDIEWSVAGEAIRLTPIRSAHSGLSVELRLERFDRGTRRLRGRRRRSTSSPSDGRGVRREDLCDRGRTP